MARITIFRIWSIFQNGRKCYFLILKRANCIESWLFGRKKDKKNRGWRRASKRARSHDQFQFRLFERVWFASFYDVHFYCLGPFFYVVRSKLYWARRTKNTWDWKKRGRFDGKAWNNATSSLHFPSSSLNSSMNWIWRTPRFPSLALDFLHPETFGEKKENQFFEKLLSSDLTLKCCCLIFTDIKSRFGSFFVSHRLMSPVGFPIFRI